MISLPVDLLGGLLKDVVFIKTLVSFFFTSRTYRLTDCDQNIYVGGNWYESHPLEFDGTTVGETLEATVLNITLSNITKEFSDLVLSEETKRKNCQVQTVLLTHNLGVVGSPILRFYGFVDTYDIDKVPAEFSIADELIQWRTQIPRRRHDEHCTWKDFKGVECQYAGAETWCDRSKARCLALSNYVNFGGFSHVVELQDKEIWWGRLQKSWMNYVSQRQKQGH